MGWEIPFGATSDECSVHRSMGLEAQVPNGLITKRIDTCHEWVAWPIVHGWNQRRHTFYCKWCLKLVEASYTSDY